MAKTYVDNVGATLILDCKTTLTGATSVKIAVMKPDGSTTEWTAAVYLTNYIKYTIVADDFNIAGDYRVQAQFVLGGWSGRGETAIFRVYKKYE